MARTQISRPVTDSISSTKSRTAVVLVNLGTPTAPTPAAVRRYLAEFLSDPRVVDTPRWLWWPLLHGVILRIRPRRSAHAYASIWTADGSPLLVHSRALAARLGDAMSVDNVRVELAMRYGEPALDSVLAKLRDEGFQRLLILPLYPQYAGASTGSVLDAATRALPSGTSPAWRAVHDYHDDPAYIDALATSIEAHWQQHDRTARLLLSYHGLPQRHVDRGDPYLTQCTATTQRLRERLGLDENQLTMSFQSRVGREVWLGPDTETVLTQWAAGGVGEVQVVCPGFAVDCLETLEEIAIRYREAFLAAGGARFEYIPALNDSDAHVHALRDLIRRFLGDWDKEASRAGA